jgi:hypothetical protein
MGWNEAYQEKQQGLAGLTSQLMQKNQAEESERSQRGGGLFQLLGGAALMIFGGPAGIAAGTGMAAAGFEKMF